MTGTVSMTGTLCNRKNMSLGESVLTSGRKLPLGVQHPSSPWDPCPLPHLSQLPSQALIPSPAAPAHPSVECEVPPGCVPLPFLPAGSLCPPVTPNRPVDPTLQVANAPSNLLSGPFPQPLTPREFRGMEEKGGHSGCWGRGTVHPDSGQADTHSSSCRWNHSWGGWGVEGGGWLCSRLESQHTPLMQGGMSPSTEPGARKCRSPLCPPGPRLAGRLAAPNPT